MSLALRENSLTRVKRENGAEHDVEVRETFLKPRIVEEKEGGMREALNSRKSLMSEIHRGKEQSKEAKF